MLKRLPKPQDILSVYAVIMSMLFAWSLLLFFWYLASWAHFMTVGDIVGVFSYVMASSFIESLAFLLFLLVVCFLLPQNLFRDDFVVRGTVISVCVIGMIMIYFRITNTNISDLLFSWVGLGAALAIIAVSLFMTKFKRVRDILVSLSDRLTVFLYIFIPLSIFSMLVVAIRNIF